ncbi:hypothetical protein [Rickettsia endosymbiont of Orchestes rusci]|uniref:hypothetical protein n=1 Tax=Rickettsia endosymbiont of Orchestes rusci TaxID=3066250 RepID=UPI00313D71F8
MLILSIFSGFPPTGVVAWLLKRPQLSYRGLSTVSRKATYNGIIYVFSWMP